MVRLGSKPRFLNQLLVAVLVVVVVAMGPVALTIPGAAQPIAAAVSLPLLRKAPGPSPQQTIDNVLRLGGDSEAVIVDAVQRGLEEPGWTFSRAIHERVVKAEEGLQQASEALDLSNVPQILRPMTGVAQFLRLYSLIRYDLAQRPNLMIPDEQQVKRERLTVWSLPGSPIALSQIPPHRSEQNKGQHGCRQCSAGDFLFTPETLDQIPSDFEKVFAGHNGRRHRFGADLFTYWALLPGGALPPKLFFLLPQPVRLFLLTTLGGQSLLQWILLIPVTILMVAVLGLWLWKLRHWNRSHQYSDGPRIHLLRAVGLLPPLAIVWSWQWFAIDWINLYGERQAAVLTGGTIADGLLLATFVYLLLETVGQCFTWKALPNKALLNSTARLQWVRRRGSGQIMTLARIAGLVIALLVLIRTGRALGITSVTLLALSSVPALAISLGTQQLIHDIADGFSLLLDGQIKPGSFYLIGTPKSGEIAGQVTSLGMRSLRLQKEDGSIVTIPNSSVASSVVTRLEQHNPRDLEASTM